MIKYQGALATEYGDDSWDDIYIFSVEDTSQSVIAVVSEPISGEVPDEYLEDVVMLRVYPQPSLESWVSDHPPIYQEVVSMDSIFFVETAKEESDLWSGKVKEALEKDTDFQEAISKIRKEDA